MVATKCNQSHLWLGRSNASLLKIPQFLIPASDFKDELDGYFCVNDKRRLPSKELLTTVGKEQMFAHKLEPWPHIFV